MNSKIHRCGWCGHPTDSGGEPLSGDLFEKAVRILNTYGDRRTHKLNGNCCPNGDGHPYADRYVRVTRDMAHDAGMPEIEGSWTKW